MMQFAALVLVALWGSAGAQRALPITSFQYPSAPLLPIAPLASFAQSKQHSPIPPAQRRTTTAHLSRPTVTSQQYVSRVDPCNPTPCGPNTRCEVNSKNIALCKCQDNFVPDGHTINGCKPQCLSDFECPDDYRCELSISKCERLCPLNECGINALCIPRNHKSVCKCPDGYSGNPDVSCSRRHAPSADVPSYTDPCSPNPCGTNAECSSDGQRAVCKCLQRYEGDPLGGCARSECINSDDCPRHQACQGRRCIDPCRIPMICGGNTDCDVRNHQPICSCRTGHVGDPFEGCRRFDPEELCRPSPCASNTNCRVQNNRAVCTCIENYIGDPLRGGCRPECVYYSDCRSDQDCVNNRCVNPCSQPGACGEGALCDVRNGRATCSCPEHYRGSPNTRCYPECTAHQDCPSFQACYELKCVDPCVGACGSGAQCRVENHKAICSCPKGFTGHPFEECKPFNREDLCRPNPCGTNADCTPGYDREGNDRPVCTCRRGYLGNPLHGCIQGECVEPSDCRDNETCFENKCQTACYIKGTRTCGTSADCTMRNHRPICSCPNGYSGDPLSYCSPSTHNRYIVGRSK